MGRRFTVRYPAASDMRAHIEEHEARGVILLPMREPPDLDPLEPITLALQVEGASSEVAPDVDPETAAQVESKIVVEVIADLVQVLPAAGLVVRMTQRGDIDLEAFPKPEGPPRPPRVVEDQAQHEGSSKQERQEGMPKARGTRAPLGSSALSWSVEKLRAEWDGLSMPERIRVARYGKRGARMIVISGRDKTLAVHLLSNPNISTDEIAAMARSAALDPAALRRIVSNREWLRSVEVTRNLICNPKLPLPEVERLLRLLSQDELARLSKSGRLRASVRQAIQKRLARK